VNKFKIELADVIACRFCKEPVKIVIRGGDKFEVPTECPHCHHEWKIVAYSIYAQGKAK